VTGRTGTYYTGLAIAGLSILIAAILLLLLPNETRATKVAGHDHLA
jgi:hypothetical protein